MRLQKDISNVLVLTSQQINILSEVLNNINDEWTESYFPAELNNLKSLMNKKRIIILSKEKNKEITIIACASCHTVATEKSFGTDESLSYCDRCEMCIEDNSVYMYADDARDF